MYTNYSNSILSIINKINMKILNKCKNKSIKN